MQIPKLLKKQSFRASVLSDENKDCCKYLLSLKADLGGEPYVYHELKPEVAAQLIKVLDRGENIVQIGDNRYAEVAQGDLSMLQIKKILGLDFFEDRLVSDTMSGLINAERYLSVFDDHNNEPGYEIDENIIEAQMHVKKAMEALKSWKKRGWLRFPYMTQYQVFSALEAYREAYCFDKDENNSWNKIVERFRAGQLFERDIELIESAWNGLVKRN